MDQQINSKKRPIKFSKNIWIITVFALLATVLIVGSGIYLWQRTGVKSATQSKISFQIADIPNLNAVLSFNSSNCVKLSQNSYFDNKNIIPEFCRKYYNNQDYIAQDNFSLEINRTNDQQYLASDLGLLTSEGRFSEPVKKTVLEEYVKKYDAYMQSQPEEYRVSLFLNDKTGKDEVGRWYLTKNTVNLKKDELFYWNYCEAGCPIWPEDVVGDYIIWQYNLNPETGAGNKCWDIWDKGTYEGDKQTKCEIITSYALLENLSFDLKN